MTYKRVVARRFGPPEVLEVEECARCAPRRGEVRVRVLTGSVCRPDLSVRQGASLYHGTPLGQKLPLVPGYAVIGKVDAIGAGVRGWTVGARVGALTVTGGYSEYLYLKPEKLIPVPLTVDPVAGVTVILNYIVAYQCLHRVAKVQPGETALIIGASGGIGTALMQLGRLAGLRMYGVASKAKHGALDAMGVTPIDYKTEDFVAVMRTAEPAGIDVVLDGMMRSADMARGLRVLRRGRSRP